MAGATQTMYKPGVYQNSLQAVPFPQHLTGYKDPLDSSHKSDKSAFIRSAADVPVLHKMCTQPARSASGMRLRIAKLGHARCIMYSAVETAYNATVQ